VKRNVYSRSFIIIGYSTAVVFFALPIFYIITVAKKKQYAYSSAIYILSIISISVLVFLLIGIALSMIYEGITNETTVYTYMVNIGMILFSALLAASLVLNINLLKYSGSARKERWQATGWQPKAPDNTNRKPTHVASLVIGIISIVSFFGFVTIGIPSIVCGIVGIVLSRKARPYYKSDSGMILSIIGLIFGLIILTGSILIRIFYGTGFL